MSKSASFHIFSYLISDINCSFRLSPSVHRNHGVREKKPKHRHIEDDYDFIDLGSPIKPVSSPKSNPDVPKEKDKDKDVAAKVLPDAKMYATWSWDQKSYREPLSLANRRTRMGSVQLSNVNGNSRRASESR